MTIYVDLSKRITLIQTWREGQAVPHLLAPSQTRVADINTGHDPDDEDYT
jgi:hypothetical protein